MHLPSPFCPLLCLLNLSLTPARYPPHCTRVPPVGDVLRNFDFCSLLYPYLLLTKHRKTSHVILRKAREKSQFLEEPQRSVEGGLEEFPWSQGLRDSDYRTKADPKYVRTTFQEKSWEKGSLSGKNKLIFPDQFCALYK